MAFVEPVRHAHSHMDPCSLFPLLYSQLIEHHERFLDSLLVKSLRTEHSKACPCVVRVGYSQENGDWQSECERSHANKTRQLTGLAIDLSLCYRSCKR